MEVDQLAQDAILRVGEVVEVDGTRIVVKVDREKNLTDIFLDGSIVRNISVNSFIELRKGYLTLIGKVDGERIEEPFPIAREKILDEVNKNDRYLSISLCGFIGLDGRFEGGAKELPLIGNEAYIVGQERLLQIHRLCERNELSISIGEIDTCGIAASLPIDGLFNSHIAIFGNTGSGKSNTLASLYQHLLSTLSQLNQQALTKNSRFLLFDFNGEYSLDGCISKDKDVFRLSTRVPGGRRLPMPDAGFLDLDMLAILCSATDKTQKPFLRRAIDFYRHIFSKDDPCSYFKSIARKEVKHALQMSDKVRVGLIVDYVRSILPPLIEDEIEVDLLDDLEWVHKENRGFKVKSGANEYLSDNPQRIESTKIYRHIDSFKFSNDIISKIIVFLYLQLIKDILSNRAQNEHIAPVINKLRSKQRDIEYIFDSSSDDDFWKKNFVVIDLSDVNLEMKKTIPLLISKKVYGEHKRLDNNKSLNIIIDEAHNILSTESFRETESWKDYRLETFEEIIKEGRKFGVFCTISSQRPSDISPTITSQAHNYFIHRLVNQKDLQTVANAVSFIDKITSESIPTLPVGTCIFSGVASQMPLKLGITELPESKKPRSETLRFSSLIKHQR